MIMFLFLIPFWLLRHADSSEADSDFASDSSFEDETPQLQKTLEMTLPEFRHGEKATGKVTLTQRKDNVLLEFEGRDLLKGEYSIVSVPTCASVKKGVAVPERKLVDGSLELFRFTTDYGNIMNEKALSSISIRSGEANDVSKKAIAFFKVSREKYTALFCGEGSAFVDPNK